MPTSERTASMFLPPAVSSMPSTTMRPCCTVSSRLMQRIKVDLPEPDGPQITMRSPARTSRSMSVSAWNLPYHLLTASIPMIDSALARAGTSSVMACGVRLALGSLQLRQRSAEPLLIQLVELAVRGVLRDELVDALQQVVLALPHRDGHLLLLQRELVFVGVRGHALGDLRGHRE